MESQNVEGPWGRSMKKDKNNKREKKEKLTSLPSSVPREGWELLTHGKSITVEHSDLTVSTPKITFLDLKK